ncbi:MAG: dihydrodipicolinate synthase family protein, partial [Thermomicrobiaceae bacterium]|nr:dihydrodipicolinate synthase family protein [Thermomicrobiaceae bacterium]
MADTRERRYPGVYAAMPTPLTAERAVDRAGIRRVVDYLLGSGIDGLSILGSTGECAALSQRQRREALEAVLDAAAGRGTIFTGAAGTVVEDVLADLQAAGGTGVAGALVPPPFYFRLDTRGVVDFYQRLAEASPVPILLYHIPQMTKVPIPLEAVARLAEHPNVIGIKDSSGDFDTFTALARLARDLPGFTVLTGSDSQLAAALLVGGHGIIGAGVNIVPDVAAALYRAWQAGDLARAVDLQQRIV